MTDISIHFDILIAALDAQHREASAASIQMEKRMRGPAALERKVDRKGKDAIK